MNSRIEINPRILQGKPVVRNTRIPVELLRKFSEGASVADLLDAYPRINQEDIKACLAYAAGAISREETYTLESA